MYCRRRKNLFMAPEIGASRLRPEDQKEDGHQLILGMRCVVLPDTFEYRDVH